MPNSKPGEGVPDSYKERAKAGGDVLWHCTIRGRDELTKGIPLHMSLKVFPDHKDMDIEEIKIKLKDFNIKKPDPKKLRFSTKVFKSEYTGETYYMLMVGGCDENYAKFYESMKHCGTVYKEFMAHVTIDKELFESINEKPLEAHEVEFSNLCIEKGAGNTCHEFEKSESLEKGFVRNAALGMSLAAGVMGLHREAQGPGPSAPKAAEYSSNKMLRTIASVESSKGKNQEHKPASQGIHGGEAAYGKYGLMPNTIRETIKLNRDLQGKHKKALSLKGDDLHHYMEDNPGLEDDIASRHLKRLEHHFGQDPEKIGYSWLNGIKGGYDAKKQKKDIKNHWHVVKIKHAYDSGE